MREGGVCLTLSEQDVAHGGVHIVVDRVSAVDHQPVDELHGLGPLAPQLAGHHHLAALSAALHDEAQHAVARPGGGGANATGGGGGLATSHLSKFI